MIWIRSWRTEFAELDSDWSELSESERISILEFLRGREIFSAW